MGRRGSSWVVVGCRGSSWVAMVAGRGSRVAGRESRVADRGSRVASRGSRVAGRGSRVVGRGSWVVGLFIILNNIFCRKFNLQTTKNESSNIICFYLTITNLFTYYSH